MLLNSYLRKTSSIAILLFFGLMVFGQFPDKSIKLEPISTYHTGIFDEGAAEITDFDPESKRIFVVNGALAQIDILSIVDPYNPNLIGSIDITPYGKQPNSVGVKNGIVAVAAENINKQDNGTVAFFDTDGTFLKSVTVGALPDMLIFTPDGKKILVANEGEPNDDYTIDPEGTVSIIDISGGIASLSQANVQEVNFQSFNNSTLDPTIRIFGPNATVAQDLEPEFIAVDKESKTAFVTLQENNAIAIIDIPTATVKKLVGLGFRNRAAKGLGIDASDKDGTINIKSWPVFGMFQPDGIKAFSKNGKTFFATANEGDSRDYDGYSEEARVKDLKLNPAKFSDSTLQENENLGRLKVSTALANKNSNGEYRKLYHFGTRSFSIYNENGKRIFDSGQNIERILSLHLPDYFNADNDDNDSFDKRSDDKGPEPEGVEIGQIDGSNYLFLGLERVGGIMVFNVGQPNKPKFIQYINNRNFDAEPNTPEAGDLGPEGLLFIPKDKSPNKRPLLVVANEVSGTVTIYQINVNKTKDKHYRLETFNLETSSELKIGDYQGMSIFEGGISGLHHVKKNKFLLITDRGPNAVANNHPLANGNNVKLFPFPEYAPKIIVARTKWKGKLYATKIKSVKRPNGTGVSGLPLPINQGGTGEVAWSDTNATVLPSDNWGLDSEGIVEDKDGNLWISDEYGSSIWKLKANGKVMNRYTPFPIEPEDIAIDSMVGKRRPNRGFEGIAYTPNGKIYAVLQSPIYNPNQQTSDASNLHRILEIDPITNQTRTFLYEHSEAIGDIANKDWKLGDLVAINNDEFLLLEHAQKNQWNFKNIIKINISNATPITQEIYNGKTLEQIGNEGNLSQYGIIPVEKELYLDLLELGWDLSHDKPEGITIMNSKTIAVINDNDYGIDSPYEDGNIVTTGVKTTLYRYKLPVFKKLDFVPSAPIKELNLGTDDDALVETQSFVFPNPVYNGTVFFTELVQEVKVFNTRGQVVLTGKNTKSLNVESLMSGIYLFENSDGRKSRVIIVQ